MTPDRGVAELLVSLMRFCNKKKEKTKKMRTMRPEAPGWPVTMISAEHLKRQNSDQIGEGALIDRILSFGCHKVMLCHDSEKKKSLFLLTSLDSTPTTPC